MDEKDKVSLTCIIYIGFVMNNNYSVGISHHHTGSEHGGDSPGGPPGTSKLSEKTSLCKSTS